MKPPSIVIDHFLSTKWSKKLFTINHYELQNGKCIVTQELSAYVCVEQDNTYFNDKLYTGEIKHQNKVNTYHRIITSEIDGSIMNTIKQVFTSFGKMDYMRIDGKLYNNKFYMIEFTPDASLSAHCSFKDIYEYQNKTYDNLMEDIINSSLENYRIQ